MQVIKFSAFKRLVAGLVGLTALVSPMGPTMDLARAQAPVQNQVPSEPAAPKKRTPRPAGPVQLPGQLPGQLLGQPVDAAGSDAPCGPSAIGLSRTVEIDATNGPRYGHQQYKELDFLKDGEIVLTFDDGPSSIYTPRVLEALNFHCTKATFYMVGSRALGEPKIVQEINRRGHTIGTHTWSHANLRNIGIERAKPEFELGFSGVQKALGKPIAPFFRFPYLADSRAMQEYARSRHMAMFSIDIDAYDYKTLQPVEVHKAIMRQVLEQRKGIILFHDIQPATAGALKNLLSDLKSKGFRVVHTVPKANAQTLSPYDLQATQQLAQRTMAAQANPLVTRAATFGRTGEAVALPGPGKPIAGEPIASAAVATTSAPKLPAPWRPSGNDAYTPPPVASSGPSFPPVNQPIQPPRRVEDSEWRNRIFRN